MSIFDDGFKQKAMEGALPRIATERPSSFGENLGAAWDSFRYTDRAGAYDDHIFDAYEKRAKLIEDLTGEKVGNPYGKEVNSDAIDRFVEGAIDLVGGAFGAKTPAEMREAEIQEYEARVTAALDRLPEEQRRLVATRAEIEAQIAREAKRLETRQGELAATGGWQGVAGQFLGGMAAAMTTPEQLATLPLGAPGKMGVVARILTEAAIGAGTEAALQPGVQAQRDQMDLEAGFGPAMQNIGLGAAGGAVFAGGVEAARALIRGGRSAFEKKFGRPPTKTEEAALDVARQALEVEATTPYVAKDAATAAVYQANQKAATAAAIEGRPVRPDEILTPAPIETRAIEPQEGNPYQILRGEDITAIGTDARLMQFKEGGDEFGVTDRLQGVKTWEPERAGVMIVYEYSDGRRIIADGHQRLGLAKRLASEGQDVMAAAIILRQQDGITPAMARARAAFKNMAEGTGTATDAAKILRDSGATLADLNLPPRSAMLRDAEGLANVNDDVFGMVINEVIPERYAAAIGRMVNDALLQTDIAGLLNRLKPSNLFEAEQIIDQARQAPVVEGRQTSLFGDEEVAESLYLERARVLERAQKLLRQDASTFRTLISRGEDIADAGNILDQGANAARLEADQKIMQFIRSLSNRKGPIADALSAAATTAKSDGNYARAARAFLEAVSGRIDDPEVIGSAGRGDRGDPGFTDANPAGSEGDAVGSIIPDDATLNIFDDPDSAGAQERVTRLRSEIEGVVADAEAGFALPEIGAPVHLQRRPADQIQRITNEFKASQPARSLEETYAVIPEHQAALEKVGKTLGRRKGVTFTSPGIKAKEGAAEKMVRKGYESTSELTDLVRAGFEVETPAQANALVASLAKSFRVLDEGWQANGQLYFDRKVLVQFQDGTIGEVQIWNPTLLKAKNSGGHKLYTKMRSLDEASDEFQALNKAQRDLYGAAIDQLSDDWLEEVWVSSAANGGNAGTLGKIWTNMRDSTGVPESRTSSTEAGSQAEPPTGTNSADLSLSTTAGRPSQLKNERGIDESPHVDTTYIGDAATPAQGLSAEPGAEGLPQTLLPGVEPVRDADRLALDAGRSLDASRDPGMDFGLFGDDAAQLDLVTMLRNEGSSIRGMEIPVGEALDADGNKVARVETLGQILDDIAADDEFLRQLDICDRSAV